MIDILNCFQFEFVEVFRVYSGNLSLSCPITFWNYFINNVIIGSNQYSSCYLVQICWSLMGWGFQACTKCAFYLFPFRRKFVDAHGFKCLKSIVFFKMKEISVIFLLPWNERRRNNLIINENSFSLERVKSACSKYQLLTKSRFYTKCKGCNLRIFSALHPEN